MTLPRPLGNVPGCCANASDQLSRGADEAHVSAEPEQTQTHARVSGEDEHSGRAKGAEAAPGQGALAPDSLRPRGGGQSRFPRAARLVRAADFSRALKVGRRVRSGPFALHIAHASRGGVRLGIIIGRPAGGAAVRNRIKRSLREYFRQHRNTFPPGTDLVVAVVRGLSSLTGFALHRAVAEAFQAAAVRPSARGTKRGTSDSAPR